MNAEVPMTMEQVAYTAVLHEVEEILTYPPTRCAERCHAVYQLLLRHIKQLAVTHQLEGYGVVAQLAHCCQHYGLAFERYEGCFRRIRTQAFQPSEVDGVAYRRDLVCAAQFIAATTGQALPEAWQAAVAEEEHQQVQPLEAIEKCRIVVSSWDDGLIYGHILDAPTTEPCVVAMPLPETPFGDLPQLLYVGAQLNLLHTTVDGSGIISARYVVLEPDYLIDISALSACIKPYGAHPLNYVLRRFEPRCVTLPILKGSVANQFMDDCLHEAHTQTADELFAASMSRVFRQQPISFTCSPEAESINKSFFDDCRRQFDNIYASVKTHFGREDIDLADILIEPAFLCETLGIRGRMDVLSTDSHTLIELKSGKADEWGGFSMKDEHAIQAALYKAVLYYNFGVNHAHCEAYVYYSKYPELCPIGNNTHWVEQALQARNRIVAMERSMCRGDMEVFFDQLHWSVINEAQNRSSFVERYLRPAVEQMCQKINTLSALEKAYFSAFVSFVEREQFYAKIGDNRIGSTRGFAQVWRMPEAERMASGEAISGITLLATEGGDAVERLHLQLPEVEDLIPNYDVGDMVLFYCKRDTEATATNQQVNNAYIEALDGKHITLRLQYKQRNKAAFSLGQHYVIDRSTTDSSFAMMYRNLYAFLNLPAARKATFLAQQPPTYDTTKALAMDHGDCRINEVVLRAKQANDFFLLIGPPGSGKTSRMLRAMVMEFLADPQHADDNLLLVAYTNQAVHEICEMLASIPQQPHYLRLGTVPAEPALAQHHITTALAGATKRSEVAEVIEHCHIWVATLHTMTNNAELFSRKHFACAIIDEASQVLEPQFLGLYAAMSDALTPAIDKFVLIGDHKQLPAVVLQNEGESAVPDTQPLLHAIGLTDLRHSIFERLYHNFSNLPAQDTLQLVDRLTTQGRMHEDIGRFAAQEFYDNQLAVACPERQCLPLDYKHVQEGFEHFIAHTRMGFVDVAPYQAGLSLKHNRAEAEAVAAIIDTLHRLHANNGKALHAAEQIGVIVPFRNQISMIRQCLAVLPWPHLEHITIDTVECYQGSQRDFIIFSTTVSTPFQLDILSAEHHGVDRKLNVALTRAKQQQFVVGQARLLRQKPVYAHLIDYCHYWQYVAQE